MADGPALTGSEVFLLQPIHGWTPLSSVVTLCSTAPTIVGGTMDNTIIGGTTPAAATVTTFTATGVALFSNASVSMTKLPTSDPHVVGQLWANTKVVTVSAG